MLIGGIGASTLAETPTSLTKESGYVSSDMSS